MSKTSFNKVDLLLKEIEDRYVQENFYRLKLYLENLDLGDDIINVVNNAITQNATDAESATQLKISRIAQEAIFENELVKAFSATHVELASGDATKQDAVVLGIAGNDAAIGQSVDIILLGVASDAAFAAFTVNDLLFLDVDGGITNVKRTSGYHVIIGKSLGGNDILCNPESPVTIA